MDTVQKYRYQVVEIQIALKRAKAGKAFQTNAFAPYGRESQVVITFRQP